MKGHIRQRAKGSRSIVIDVGTDPQTGKRRQQWHTVHGTKREAEAKMRELLQSVETGGYVKPGRLTLGEWLEQWCQTSAQLHVSHRTAQSYWTQLRLHVVPALGAIPLCRLEAQQLQDYYARALAEGRADGTGGLSARTVLYQHRIISQALNQAMKMGLVVRNVAKAVDPPKPRRVRIATMAAEDIPRFVEAAGETPYSVLYLTALGTGMRLGEVLGLRWRDVDLDLGHVFVVQSLYKRSGVCEMIEPKSAHSRRQIALPPSLALLLREHQAKQERESGLLGKEASGDDLVFAHPDGTPLDPGTVGHTFTNVLRTAGIPHIRFHDLRHTHATLMLKSSVHPKVVSERLGHASVAFTLDTYSHVVPGLQEAAAERFDKILQGDVSKMLAKGLGVEREPPETRTLNLLIKSQLLYLLS